MCTLQALYRNQPTIKGTRMQSKSFSLPSALSSSGRSPASLCSWWMLCKCSWPPMPELFWFRDLCEHHFLHGSLILWACKREGVSLEPLCVSKAWMNITWQRKALKQGVLLFYSCRDGIPPYRLRKQHRREMQESAKANGRVPLPHIPVSSTISFPGVNMQNM